MLKRIDELFTENSMYGSRRLQQMLRREAVLIGRRRIRRLMRKLGLWAVGAKPNTSKPHPQHKIYPYLQRDLVIERPNQVWALNHHQHPHASRLLVPVRDPGLGQAQSPGLAAVKHAEHRLPHRSAEGGTDALSHA